MMAQYPAMTESGKPGWIEVFEKELKENPKDTTYTIATLDPPSQPKVRFVIHRGLTPESNIFLATTDVRMQKANQLAQEPSMEFAWWIGGDTNIQFRVQGKAYVVPNDLETPSDKLKECVKKMGAKGDEADAQWWISQKNQQWEKMSGHLRASFARPTPGTPLKDIDSKPEDWPETIPAKGENDEQKAQIKEALRNFALLAIVPETFELLELKPVPNRRNGWKRQTDGSSWTVTSVVP